MMPVFVNDVVADEPEHADGNTEIEIEVGKFWTAVAEQADHRDHVQRQDNRHKERHRLFDTATRLILFVVCENQVVFVSLVF